MLFIAKIKAKYPMGYQQLTDTKFQRLFQKIIPLAISLSNSVFTVLPYNRELKRNRGAHHNCPESAYKQTINRRAKAAKRRVSSLTQALVRFGLERDWSPEQISAISRLICLPVSHEWIYQYIMKDKAQGGHLFKHLRQGHKTYRRGKNGKHEPIKNAVSIDKRPEIVDTKERFGDWEADTVIGKMGTVAHNFEVAEYKDEQDKTRPMYRITKDGLVYLAMDFTGTKAAQFKEADISAFNQMEKQLHEQQHLSNTSTSAPDESEKFQLLNNIANAMDFKQPVVVIPTQDVSDIIVAIRTIFHLTLNS